MSYKAIVFDYDDTLVLTKTSKWDAIKGTARRFYNLNISNEGIEKYWGKPFQEMLTNVFNHVDTYENLSQHYSLVSQEFPMQEVDDAV